MLIHSLNTKPVTYTFHKTWNRAPSLINNWVIKFNFHLWLSITEKEVKNKNNNFNFVADQKVCERFLFNLNIIFHTRRDTSRFLQFCCVFMLWISNKITQKKLSRLVSVLLTHLKWKMIFLAISKAIWTFHFPFLLSYFIHLQHIF